MRPNKRRLDCFVKINCAFWPCLCAFLFFIAGCASTPRVDWNSRVGVYTFDQSLIDLGPPDKQSPLSNGGTVAEWITRQHGRMSFGVGTGFSTGGMGVGVGQSVGSGYNDRVLKLIFGPDGRLASWSKNY